MLNSKFKAHLYRLSALLLLLPLSFTCLSLHSLAADDASNKDDSKQIKVQLYADDEPLSFKMADVNYLNFTASIGLVSPEAKFTSDDNFQIKDDELVQLALPESASASNFATDKDLKDNELTFTAKRPTAWLLNLQLKGYNLQKSSFDATKQLLRLNYHKLSSETDYQANYFSGELNAIQAKKHKDLATERKNLHAVLQAAGLDSDAKAPIYNVLNGQLITGELEDSCYLFGQASAKKDLAPALQTLSYTLIYQGKAVQAELYNLQLVQTSQSNVYDKNADVRHDSDRADSEEKSTAALTVATSKDSKSELKADDKVTEKKAEAKMTTSKTSSKYKTKVISPNDTSIVPSTGETAASLGISMLCFISATAIYAIKRHLR